MTEPKNPWSDEQIQSTPGGPADDAPWKVTYFVIAGLVVLLLVGYLLWRAPGSATPSAAPAPAASPAGAR